MKYEYKDFVDFGYIEIRFTRNEAKKLDRLVNLNLDTSDHDEDWDQMAELQKVLSEMKKYYFAWKIDEEIQYKELLKQLQEQKAKIEKE